MLFNSYPFILAFLPVVLAGFYLTNARSRITAIVWLGFASLFFYGWWDWRFLPLLLASILFNFYAGILLTRIDGAKQARMRRLVASSPWARTSVPSLTSSMRTSLSTI